MGSMVASHVISKKMPCVTRMVPAPLAAAERPADATIDPMRRHHSRQHAPLPPRAF